MIQPFVRVKFDGGRRDSGCCEKIVCGEFQSHQSSCVHKGVHFLHPRVFFSSGVPATRDMHHTGQRHMTLCWSYSMLATSKSDAPDLNPWCGPLPDIKPLAEIVVSPPLLLPRPINCQPKRPSRARLITASALHLLWAFPHVGRASLFF